MYILFLIIYIFIYLLLHILISYKYEISLHEHFYGFITMYNDTTQVELR